MQVGIEQLALFALDAWCQYYVAKIGNQAMGAPDLTNNVWLHGWGEQAIVRAISNGLHNVMPGQARLLTPEQIHVLGAYVWSLSRPTQVAKQ